MYSLLCSVFTILAATEGKSVVAISLSNIDSSKSHQEPVRNYPYVVGIWNHINFECVGSIISEYHVITTAACANNAIPNFGGYINAGSDYRNQNGTLHKIEQVITHEDYNETEVLNDIALIKVVEPFKFDGLRQKIELIYQNEEIKPKTKAIVATWGDTESGEDVEELREFKVFVISHKQCSGQYSWNGGLTDGEMCAGSRYFAKYILVCLDVGDPLVIDGRLVGLASWGDNCAEAPYVYTKVSHYREWIDEKMKLSMGL
ncbi:hypothetical protein QAD02_006378 [Eretmocerus hayati]|uniref:Uncharacterized protein n=1 Tax=Eretmocerus hayati TaxID=131215 RepID=A0ACC2N117_9HYME|nr:hypothetical protein QAD02_006378 [Eretmocerus hayati]